MITHYIKTFSNLRSDTSRSRWTSATKYRAPHKPLLLLAVIDLLTLTKWSICFSQNHSIDMVH